MGVDKDHIIKELMTSLKKKIEHRQKTSNSLKEIIEKFGEKASLKTANLELVRMAQELETLKEIYNYNHKSFVSEGTLVVINNKGCVEKYFILLCMVGEILWEGTSQEVVIISPESPIGLALMGKNKNDTVKVYSPIGEYEILILSVE